MISIFLSEQFLRHSEPIEPLEISTFAGKTLMFKTFDVGFEIELPLVEL